jgi:hypothetical protein
LKTCGRFCIYFHIFSHNLPKRTASKNSPDICQLTSSLNLPQKYFLSSSSALKFTQLKLEWFPLKDRHFLTLVWTIWNISRVREEMRFNSWKMSEEFFDAFLLGRLCEKMGNKMQNQLHAFVRNKYTTFSSVRIVALRSVNISFPGS